MNDKISKYLFVDSKNMTKTCYLMHKNGYINIYEEDYIISSSKIFKKNNVPKEYRKIIIKLNCLLTPSNKSNMSAEEFITGKEFIIKVNRKDSVRCFEGVNNQNSNLFKIYDSPQNRFVEYSETYTHQNVLEYLRQMLENGCLENYIKSIFEILEFNKKIEFNEIKAKIIKKDYKK